MAWIHPEGKRSGWIRAVRVRGVHLPFIEGLAIKRQTERKNDIYTSECNQLNISNTKYFNGGSIIDDAIQMFGLRIRL